MKEAGDIVNVSSIIETEPWGFNDNIPFYNQVIELHTPLLADALMRKLLDIEKKLGRTREGKGYAGRTMDLDILFYDNTIIHSELLQIPHPRLHLRLFVLQPLAEIAPTFVHPLFKKNISTLLNELPDNKSFRKVLSVADFINQANK